MKLTKVAMAAIVGASALVVGVGAGVGIGFGAFGVSQSATVNAVSTGLFTQQRSADPLAATLTTNTQLEQPSATANLPVKLVTDAGEVNDRSFNEQAADALRDIYYSYNGERNANITRYFVRPASESDADISSGYANAVGTLGATTTTTGSTSREKKVIIAPGFFHSEAIKTYQTANPTDDTTFIGIDYPATNGFGPGATILNNVYSVQFDTKTAGFQAGLLSGLYLEEIDDPTPTVGTWGGGPFPGVTDFMVGFVAGIKYYNDNNSSFRPDVTFIKFADPASYTNTGFTPGGGRINADFLVSNNVDIILPVAGPQTRDAIASINAANRETLTKIIGVDVDQSSAYPTDSDLFLTSIFKNVRKAAYEAYKSIATGTDSPLLGPATAVGTSSKDFRVGLENGFTGYVKQFTSGRWTSLYSEVDGVGNASVISATVLIPAVPAMGTTAAVPAVTLATATWANALAYINAN